MKFIIIYGSADRPDTHLVAESEEQKDGLLRAIKENHMGVVRNVYQVVEVGP